MKHTLFVVALPAADLSAGAGRASRDRRPALAAAEGLAAKTAGRCLGRAGRRDDSGTRT